MSENKYGSIPDMDWVEIDQLVVEKSYQRKITSRKSEINIQKIVENFNWNDCTPLTVSSNDDGTFNVIDGQHRLEAAKRLGDIENLPCYIIDAGENKRQAKSFVSINKNRVAITPIALHRSLVVSGDALACYVEEFCAQVGIKISETIREPNETVALSTIKEFLARKKDNELEWAIMVLRDAFPDKPRQIRAAIIKALVGLYAANKTVIQKNLMVEAVRSYGDVDMFEANAMQLAKLDKNLTRQKGGMKTLAGEYNNKLGRSQNLKLKV